MDRIASLEDILEVAEGFWKSKVLLCASGLDLFSRLDGHPATAEEVATQTMMDDRSASAFLELLADLGLLERNEVDGKVTYSTGGAASRHLSTHGSAYVGGLLRIWNTRSYRMWTHLEVALRSGSLPADARQPIAAGRRPVQVSLRKLQTFASVFDFSAYRTVCDLGGTADLGSIASGRGAAQIEWTSIDAAKVRETSLPPAGVYTMGRALHGLEMAHRRRLIRRVYEALPERGALVVIGNLVNDERPINAVAQLDALLTLLELGAPSEFGIAEFTAWCREAGFQAFERLPLGGSDVATIAFKTSSAKCRSAETDEHVSSRGEAQAPSCRRRHL